MHEDIHDERNVRIDKLNELRTQGIDPYPAHVERSHTNAEALTEFDQLAKEEEEVKLVGRLRLVRRHGGSSFARLEDDSETIQLFFNKKLLGEDEYAVLKLVDVADFIAVTGTLFKTKTDERTVQVSSFKVISKAIRPLPAKFHGLKDEESRYRQRYIDLIMNHDVKNLFRLRSKFIQELRSFLHGENFIEVETPVLEHTPGGAEAEPFLTHHNTLDIDLYLRISLELHLKRLTVGGYERIFEIGKVFRNEGMSTQHLQEFTMMEFYWAYADNEKLMGMIQRMYQAIIQNTFGTLKIDYQGTEIDFSGEWPRHDYYDLFKEKSGIDLEKIETVEQLREEVKAKNIAIKIDPKAGLGRLIDQVYKKTARPDMIQPSFLINHPVAISPLSKKHKDNPKKVERHQVLILGAEVGNGFSELNDPIDQKERFEQQMSLREAGDKEAQMIDEDFVVALEHGMPPTAGFGFGVDRLFMLCTNQESIRDVVFFPIMKPKNEE